MGGGPWNRARVSGEPASIADPTASNRFGTSIRECLVTIKSVFFSYFVTVCRPLASMRWETSCAVVPSRRAKPGI
jgi:hypothetical protein